MKCSKRDLQILTYVPLVSVIVENVCQQVAQPLDRGSLAQDGVAGLVEAARTHSPKSRVPFGIYAKARIKGAILQGLLSRTKLPSLSSGQMRVTAPGVESREGERGDEFLLSLFGLQRSLGFCGENSPRLTAVGRSRNTPV